MAQKSDVVNDLQNIPGKEAGSICNAEKRIQPGNSITLWKLQSSDKLLPVTGTLEEASELQKTSTPTAKSHV